MLFYIGVNEVKMYIPLPRVESPHPTPFVTHIENVSSVSTFKGASTRLYGSDALLVLPSVSTISNRAAFFLELPLAET